MSRPVCGGWCLPVVGQEICLCVTSHSLRAFPEIHAELHAEWRIFKLYHHRQSDRRTPSSLLCHVPREMTESPQIQPIWSSLWKALFKAHKRWHWIILGMGVRNQWLVQTIALLMGIPKPASWAMSPMHALCVHGREHVDHSTRIVTISFEIESSLRIGRAGNKCNWSCWGGFPSHLSWLTTLCDWRVLQGMCSRVNAKGREGWHTIQLLRLCKMMQPTASHSNWLVPAHSHSTPCPAPSSTIENYPFSSRKGAVSWGSLEIARALGHW